MNNTQKHFHLYVLELEQGKWYIGITTQKVETRFEQHRNGFAGASWTKKYRPIGIHDSKFLGDLDEESAKLFETRVTLKYMKRYGINNVRGGDLTRTEPYVLRFGRYYLKDDWQTILALAIMIVSNVILLIDKYN